jgi:lysophospholipase L1-like esterase
VIPFLGEKEVYNKWYRFVEQLAEENSIGHISVVDRFRKIGFDRLRRAVRPDNIHPNVLGHKIIAEAIEEWL